MARSEQEIIELFKAAVYEVENKRLGEVKPATELGELGLSSVSTMEVIGELEEKLKVQFPDENLASLSTVQDLITLVQKLG
ncbi:MAG: acyl carrier protein [Deltaproteobacteria bacterium]|nr:acyl carrier protein [Deltaproteobacteria bacterium]